MNTYIQIFTLVLSTRGEPKEGILQPCKKFLMFTIINADPFRILFQNLVDRTYKRKAFLTKIIHTLSFWLNKVYGLQRLPFLTLLMQDMAFVGFPVPQRTCLSYSETWCLYSYGNGVATVTTNCPGPWYIYPQKRNLQS